MAPSKIREAGKAFVCGDPLPSHFDRYRREKSIRNEVPLSLRDSAKLFEHIPMPRAGSNNNAIGLPSQGCCELQGAFESARRRKQLGMSRDAKKSAQGQIDQTERLTGADDIRQPAVVGGVVRGVLAVA